jgi:hypothetical protein
MGVINLFSDECNLPIQFKAENSRQRDLLSGRPVRWIGNKIHILPQGGFYAF